jgi:hypothetical protein
LSRSRDIGNKQNRIWETLHHYEMYLTGMDSKSNFMTFKRNWLESPKSWSSGLWRGIVLWLDQRFTTRRHNSEYLDLKNFLYMYIKTSTTPRCSKSQISYNTLYNF